jgi:uncharacterized protein
MVWVWETEAQHVRETGARLVLLRQNLVLEREGGTLAALLPVYRRGFDGTYGPGDNGSPGFISMMQFA